MSKTRIYKSDINGQIEITTHWGKKVMDSANANYSYGSLQKVLTYGLKQSDFNTDAKVLLLGMGGGSVIKVLRNKFKHLGHITAVELDPTVIHLAKQEFKIENSAILSVVHGDAVEFVRQLEETFDLVIVDVFMDDVVPEVIYAQSFWEKIISALRVNGSLLFNAGMNGGGREKLEEILTFLNQVGRFECISVPHQTNELVIGKKA